MTNYPRKPQSGKQAGRYRLPHWLKGSVDELLRVHFAIGVGRPEAAVAPGDDVPDNVAALVAEAAPELRARCREFILGHALAPHAQWSPPEETLDAPPVTVADLERQLRELAESGDRGAILAMLAALDPARYGPPGRTVADSPDTVDVVDWVPAVVTTADRK